MNNTSLVLSFHLAVFKAWSTEPSKQRLLGQDYPLFLSSAGPNIIHLSSEDMRFFFFYPQHRCCIFPLSVSTSELPFPTQCQSFTVEWKMCPISQGQANNDWKAIEVKQTDSIQLVIAVFASVSTCEEVSRKTFFFFLQGCLFSCLPFLHLSSCSFWTPRHLQCFGLLLCKKKKKMLIIFFFLICLTNTDICFSLLNWPDAQRKSCSVGETFY